MKPTLIKPFALLLIIGASCACALMPLRADALDLQNRLYVGFDGGAAWTSKTEVREVFGAVAPGTEASFDVGPRLGVEVGYNVTEWFAGELELGLTANGIDAVTGPSEVDAELINVPLMINAKFQLPTRTLVTPYAGVGVGGAASTLDINHWQIGNTRFEGSASDTVFAWQAFAGVRFALSDRIGLGVEYRYLRSEGASFDVDWGFYYNTHSDHIKFGDIETHCVSVRFDARF